LGSKLLVEHLNEELVSPSKLEPLGKLETEFPVVGNMGSAVNVWNKVVLLNVDGEDLSCLVDHNHAVGLRVAGGNNAKLVCELLSEEQTGSRHFVHVQETEFGDDENYSVFGAVLHQNGEVTVLLNLDFSRSFELLLAWSWVSDFHDVKLLSAFSILLLAEAEEGVPVACDIADRHICESSSETLENLLLSLLDEEELHVAANLVVSSRVDANKVAPLV
jgi:hypothetical protein